MLDIPRLEVDRQINAGNALGTILAADRPTPLLPGTRARGEGVVAATLALLAARDTPPLKVDRATDAVVTAFERDLKDREQMLRDTVVPLREAQRRNLGHIRLLRVRLFVQGTDFIRLSMDLQYRHLTELRDRLAEPEVAAAVDGLGMRPEVDHLLAHIERYGRALGKDVGGAGHAAEVASDAWHEAFRRFAARLMVDYEEDAAMQRELLAPYERQLEQQRVMAKTRRARAGEGDEVAPGSAPGGGAG